MAELKGTDFIKEGFLDEEIAKMEQLKKTSVAAMEAIRKEAKSLDDGLSKVNATQKSGQDEIEKTEKRTQELIKAQEKYERSISETEQELVKLKAATAEQNRINKLNEKLTRSAEGSYDKLSAQYSLNKIELNKMSEQQRKATKTGKELEANTKAIYEEMKSLQEATGKHQLSVGDYAGKLGELVPALGAAQSGIAGVGKGLWALVANPVGAVIAGIVAAFALMYSSVSQLAGGVEALERGSATLTATWDTLLSRIGKFVSGELSLKELLFETGDAIAANVKAANDLVIARRALERQTAANALAESELEISIAKLEAVRDSDAKSLSRRRAAAIELAKEIQNQANVRLEQSKLETEAARLAVAETESGSEKRRIAQNAYTQALAEQNNAIAENVRAQANAANQIEMIRLDIFEQELDLLLDITDRQKTVNERRIADETVTLDEKKRLADENVAIIEDAYQKQIKAFEGLNGVQLDEVGILKMTGTEILKYADSLGFSERAVNRLREVVIEKLAADQDNLDSMKAIEAQEKAQMEAASKRALELRRSFVTQSNQLVEETIARDLSEIELLEETEETKTRLRLEAEKKRFEALIRINEKFGGTLSDLQIETMQNTIAKIDQELDKLMNQPDKKDIYSYLGIKVNEEDKQQITESLGFIKGNIMDIANTRVQTSQAVVQASDQEVQRAEENLNTQLALLEQGIAADVEGAQKRLSNAKVNNAKAIKEQEKAQRAQERIDTATQIGSLITATANIFKSLTGIPVIGPILAAAAVGSMFASFAASKVQARRVSRLGKGDTIDLAGGSHSSRNNEISLGVHGGREVLAEGGEKAAVFSKMAVKKYGSGINDLVDSINNGTYASEYGKAFTSAANIPEYMIKKAGADSEDIKAAYVQAINKQTEDLKSTVKNIPQPIWGVSQGRLTKAVKVGNTIYQDVRQENEW